MSEVWRRCPKDNSVLWPSAFEKGWYLCPKCDAEYSDNRTGELELVDSRWDERGTR
jgi:hypothetical protein